MKHTQWSQSGQVGLTLLLIMVLVSTVGISIANRTTKDLQSSRQNQEAVRTFSAAESALEDVLARGQTYLDEASQGSYTQAENAEVSYTVARSTELNTDLIQGSAVEVNVEPAVAGREVAIEWGSSTNCATAQPALVVAIINTTNDVTTTRYQSFAICDNSDGFILVGTSGSTHVRRGTITLQAGDRALRITAVYADTPILVQGVGWTLPVQEYTIRSTAQNTEGRETKAIEVERTRDFSPSVFDYVMGSGTSIVK